MREKIDPISQPPVPNATLSKSVHQNGFKGLTPKLTGLPKYMKPFFKAERF